MARSSLITGRVHGAHSFICLTTPGDPREINKQYKVLIQNPGDLAEINLWESLDGITCRKKFAEPKPVQEIAPPRIVVPSLEEVMQAGYPQDAAQSIIADIEAKLAAVTANPDISDEVLAKIVAIPPLENTNIEKTGDTPQAAEPVSTGEASPSEQPDAEAQPGDIPSLIPGAEQTPSKKKK